MTERLNLTIANGISEITLGDSACMFNIISYSGFAAADYDVQMSAGGSSDGGYITSARLNSRTLEIKFDFGGRFGESTRQALISFFSPHRLLTITAQRGAKKCMIAGRAIDFNITEKNIHARSIVDLSILCPDPYFQSTSIISQSAALVAQMFHLPCAFPCVLGVESSTGNLTFVNSGDAPADMVAELIAYGNITNPCIINDTNGKTIQIDSSMVTGDKLTISTVRRQKTAQINGIRCLIDPSSQFSDFLAVGTNNLRYTSDEGSSDIAANIRCTALYLGV